MRSLVTIEVDIEYQGDLPLLTAHLGAAVRTELARVGASLYSIGWDTIDVLPAVARTGPHK